MPNINTEQVRQSLAMAPDDVLLSMWKQVSKGGVQNLDYDIVKAFADEISERGLSHRLNERSENKMKITKRHLKRIIREEKNKILQEGQMPNSQTGTSLAEALHVEIMDILQRNGIQEQKIGFAIQDVIDDLVARYTNDQGLY